VKIARLKTKLGPRGMPEIELALAKPVRVSKRFHLLDVAALSHGPHPASMDLGDDSSLDVRKTPSPARMEAKRASLPPLVSGEFLHF
jgi:hypothetical protein